MQMREVIALLSEKIKIKIDEVSRLEKEVAIAKAVIHNDLRELNRVLEQYQDFVPQERLRE